MKTLIAVCGAGTMGAGIAQICAQKGFEVRLFDVFPEALKTAQERIGKNLEYLVQKKKITTQEREEIFSRIRPVTKIEDCTGDIVIEAVAEKMDIKVELFHRLAQVNSSQTIFASNTSSLSISDLQQQIPSPRRVAGMHFFNPPYIMPLVEIVSGRQTDPETIETLRRFSEALGKTAVICNDSPGFIVNRVARPYYLESLRLLEENVAGIEEIDTILEATGFKMGPFRLMDMIGMDINLATSKSVYESLGKPDRLKPSAIQEEKVNNKELGKKTGKGFYRY